MLHVLLVVELILRVLLLLLLVLFLVSCVWWACFVCIIQCGVVFLGVWVCIAMGVVFLCSILLYTIQDYLYSMPKSLTIIIISFVSSITVILAGYFVFSVYKNWDLTQRNIDIKSTQTQNTAQQETPTQNQNSIASKEFYTAVNNSVADIKAIIKTNTELTPILTELYKQNQQKDYTNFFSLVIKAKTLIKEGSIITNKLNKDLLSLSEINPTVRDVQVKNETKSFIDAGNKYSATLNSYFTSVDNLLNGHIPSEKEISKLKDNINNLTNISTAFSDQTKFLLDLLSRKS